MKTTRRTLLIATAAVALTAAVWLWPNSTQPSQQDTQTMKTFTENMTTHCVGRFLIDAPTGVDTGVGTYGFQIAKIKPIQRSTQPVEERLQRLDRELAARVAAQATWKDGYGDAMEPAFAYSPQAAVRSIWYGKPDTGRKISDQMDGYVVRADGTFLFNTNATTTKRTKEFNDFLIEIAPTLSVRESSTIPTQRGFCFDNGFIAMNPKRGESADWGWSLPGHPDVSFGFGTRSNGEQVGEGILDREAKSLKELQAAVGLAAMADIKTLRKRRFDLNGMAAQEELVEITDSKPEYQFNLEIPGKPNDLANPNITISMQVGNFSQGGREKPSLTTGEAIALWDAFIQTLRLRPGAV